MLNGAKSIIDLRHSLFTPNQNMKKITTLLAVALFAVVTACGPSKEEKEAAEGVGGYARPMPASWLDRQKVEVAKRVAQADLVITTALIPGRAAPVLVSEDIVKTMKPGSVVIDIAAGKGPDGVGGNCPLTEAGKTVIKHGVTLVGETNLPALVAADSSALYARNVLDFLKLIINKEGALHIDMEDDIVAACLMTRDGAVVKK